MLASRANHTIRRNVRHTGPGHLLHRRRHRPHRRAHLRAAVHRKALPAMTTIAPAAAKPAPKINRNAVNVRKIANRADLIPQINPPRNDRSVVAPKIAIRVRARVRRGRVITTVNRHRRLVNAPALGILARRTGLDGADRLVTVDGLRATIGRAGESIRVSIRIRHRRRVLEDEATIIRPNRNGLGIGVVRGSLRGINVVETLTQLEMVIVICHVEGFSEKW